MRFALLLALVTLSALLGVSRSDAAEAPPELGKSEIRCDDRGCALGACVVRDLWAEPLRIIGAARVVPYILDGQATGFKLFAIRPGSLFAQLLLRNGDLLRKVAGHDISSPEGFASESGHRASDKY